MSEREQDRRKVEARKNDSRWLWGESMTCLRPGDWWGWGRMDCRKVDWSKWMVWLTTGRLKLIGLGLPGKL